MFGVSGGRGLQVVPPFLGSVRAPRFSQDHKRNLISDVEKKKKPAGLAEVYFGEEGSEGGWLGGKQTGLLQRLGAGG